MNSSSRDAGIPLLTEVIDPDEALQPSSQSVSSQFPSSPLPKPAYEVRGQAPEPAVPFEQEAPAARSPAVFPRPPERSAEEWMRIEKDVHERVLLHLMSRIDPVIDARVRDALADVLQLAVASLSTEIRKGLQNNIEAMVSQAISEEVSKLRSSEN